MWELAGMTNESHGRLDSGYLPVGGNLFTLPRDAWVEDGQLRMLPGEPRPDQELDPVGMLDFFVRLRRPEDVVRFVRRFGPLWICSHGLPFTHRTGGVDDTIFFDLDPDQERCWDLWDPEPLSVWFGWVETARAILTIASFLHGDSIAPPEEWDRASQLLNPGYREKGAEEIEGDLGFARVYCGDLIWAWLDMCDISPKMEWDPQPNFYLLPKPFSFGNLGLQLSQAVMRSHGLAICSGCSNPYVRTGRKPQAGRRNYCPDCGPKAARRDAQRERRAKQRGDHGQEG